MSMNSNKKQNQETNNVKNQKEENEMANAYDDEMDLRDEAQKEAEDQENKQNKDDKDEEPSFYEKHKVAIWIGAGVVGVAGLGFGLWGVHNIGMGKTFLGAPKYHGGHKSHGRYPWGANPNYKVQQMPQQAYVPTQQQVDIPATENEPAKVVDFAEGAAKVVDAAKKIGDLKVNNL